MERIAVGVLGATGMVGQRYIANLENHPWFKVTYVAASPRSAGKTYREAVENRWLIGADIPASVGDLIVEDANNVEAALGKCKFVFSALEMGKDEIKALEEAYAAKGIPVVSNASANRWTDDVPMLIPEINPDHTDVIYDQQNHHGWDKGFIAVKPNCSLQSYMAPVFALQKAGYPVKRMVVTTMQAVSGAGYPGVSSFDMIDNVVPYIGGEEEKTERECLKILGKVVSGKIQNAETPVVSTGAGKNKTDSACPSGTETGGGSPGSNESTRQPPSSPKPAQTIFPGPVSESHPLETCCTDASSTQVFPELFCPTRISALSISVR